MSYLTCINIRNLSMMIIPVHIKIRNTSLPEETFFFENAGRI